MGFCLFFVLRNHTHDDYDSILNRTVVFCFFVSLCVQYPHKDSLVMGASMRQLEVDGNVKERGSDNVANSASYEATGSTSLIRTASRRRSVQELRNVAPFELSNMRTHLSKRHAVEFDASASIHHATVPVALAPSLTAAIVGLDAHEDAARASTRALGAYLDAKPEQAVRELRELLVEPKAMSRVTHVMRQRVLNALGQQDKAIYQV